MERFITYLTEEQERKRAFVENELAAMLCEATGCYVRELSYDAVRDDERVTVYARPYGAPREKTERFDVNVSCDSLWAIAKAVMAAVAERYE